MDEPTPVEEANADNLAQAVGGGGEDAKKTKVEVEVNGAGK